MVGMEAEHATDATLALCVEQRIGIACRRARRIRKQGGVVIIEDVNAGVLGSLVAAGTHIAGTKITGRVIVDGRGRIRL
jgi:hypothetical protein